MHILTLLAPALLGLWMLGAYNRLVRLRNVIASVFQVFAQQARERSEVVARLLALAHEHMADEPELAAATASAEQELGPALDAARLRPVHPRMLGEFGRCDHALGLALAALCKALREHVGYVDTHPDPEAQHPVITQLGRLDTVLTQTDFARLTYNQAVSDYNAAIRLFPTTVVARLFSFEPAALLPAIAHGTA